MLADADGMIVDIVRDGAATSASTESTYINIESTNGHSNAEETTSIRKVEDSFEYGGMGTMYFDVKVLI